MVNNRSIDIRHPHVSPFRAPAVKGFTKDDRPIQVFTFHDRVPVVNTVERRAGKLGGCNVAIFTLPDNLLACSGVGHDALAIRIEHTNFYARNRSRVKQGHILPAQTESSRPDVAPHAKIGHSKYRAWLDNHGCRERGQGVASQILDRTSVNRKVESARNSSDFIPRIRGDSHQTAGSTHRAIGIALNINDTRSNDLNSFAHCDFNMVNNVLLGNREGQSRISADRVKPGRANCNT